MKHNAFRTLFCIVLLMSMTSIQAVTVTYISDNTTIFKNPERGFTEELSAKVTEAKPNVVKGHIGDTWGSRNKQTLAVVLYNFNNFKDKDLPEAVLNGFDEDMQELRNHGLKCVLRFAYTETQNDIVDATPEWVKRHLEQLKPHLAANEDVIYVLEAGFVGVWGEWYYSANYGNETQHMNDNRRSVIDNLFANTPSDMFILFRYPMIKTEYLHDEAPLTSEEGFTGTVKARMGCHNDAFLNNWGNHGTYAGEESGDDPKVREYVARETMYVPNGGETNIDDNESFAEKQYVKGPEEMSTYHWSFCGSSYAVPVTSRWRKSGLFDTLNVHMGYRYNLLDAQFTDQAAPSGKMNISIRLRNVGYAPIYNARTAYIVLKAVSGQQSAISLPLTADPRRWRPNGRLGIINEQIELPADLPEGKYHLYLYLPDRHEKIAADPRYAVQIANKDMWDETTGFNDLKAEVTISKDAPLDPGELPEIQAIGEVTGYGLRVTGTTKIWDNGVLYIIRDGERYNTLGQRL